MKKILLIGASGFIGSHIAALLRKGSTQVICACRHIDKFQGMASFICDFNKTYPKEFWKEHLQGIDVVINAAGVLHDSYTNSIDHVHFLGPASLLDACIEERVSRFIHISALGVDANATSPYARTKDQFQQYLMEKEDIDWVILKPSMVVGDKGSKGYAILQRLASLPWFIPVIGKGDQTMQPVLAEDLARIVEFMTCYTGSIKQSFDVVGPESMTIKELLTRLRRKMGKADASFIHIPMCLMACAAKLADICCKGSVIGTTYSMMQHPNVGQFQPIVSFTGISPRSFDAPL